MVPATTIKRVTDEVTREPGMGEGWGQEPPLSCVGQGWGTGGAA